MWKKFIICASAMAVLTGCGNAVGEATPKKGETLSPTFEDFLSNPNMTITGGLPSTVDPDTSAFQARLVESLKDGIPTAVFGDASPPVGRSITKTGGPKPIAPSGPNSKNGKYQMYLVKNPVSRLSKSTVLTCPSGEDLYRATIAAKPYLKSVPKRTNAATETVQPYDVDVCDGKNGLTYGLVSSNSDWDNLIGTEGELPDTTPSSSIAALQTRTMAFLNEGLKASYFPNTVPEPGGMLVELLSFGQPRGWDMVDSKRRLYLVKRHLQPVPKDATQEFAEFCGSGALYSGYVAARPFTVKIIQTEALSEITASPYGLLVCNQSDTLKLKLLNANHPILKT